MPAESLKKIWILALILGITAVCCLFAANEKLLKNTRGISIFTASENIKDIKKITIETPSLPITLYEDDGIWRIEQADNYYADFNKIHHLLSAVTNAKVGNTVDISDKKDLSWTKITLFDTKEKQLGQAMISNAQKLETHYVKYADNDKVYMSTWKMQLPDTVQSWVPQHTQIIDGINVSSIEKNEVNIVRDTQGGTFYKKGEKRPYSRFEHIKIFDILTNLQYEKVLSSQEFDETRYPYVSAMRITTFDGLVTDWEIYSDYQEYWLKIKLSMTRLPLYQTKEYVEQNQFLFEDWWFKLPSDIGRVLFMLKL